MPTLELTSGSTEGRRAIVEWSRCLLKHAGIKRCRKIYWKQASSQLPQVNIGSVPTLATSTLGIEGGSYNRC